MALALPPLVYAGAVTIMLARAERAQLERSAQEAGRTIVNDFEHEVARQLDILRTLSASPALADESEATFRAQARHLTDWSGATYVLRDASGRLLANSAARAAAAPDANELTPVERQALATDRPAVSDFVGNSPTGDTRVVIALAVAGARGRLVLSAALDGKTLARVLQTRTPPPSTVVSISDRTGTVVARGDGRFVGQQLPGFAEVTQRQGDWRGTGFGGREVHGFYARSAATGYIVATGISNTALEAPLWRLMLALTALGALLIAVGYGVAIRLSRTISVTFRRLTDLAETLARGGTVPAQLPLAIAEAGALADALITSAQDLRERDEQLAHANYDLERRVDERTAEVERKTSLLATTLNAMDQGLIMVDENGIVALANRRAVDLLGLDPGFLATRPHFTEFRRVQASQGEYIPNGPEFQRWIASGELLPEQLTYERVRPNGTVLEVRSVPLASGGIVRTYSDITARRQAEKALREKTTILDATLANMDQGLLTLDSDGLVRVWNDRVVQLLDLPAEMMRGQPHFQEIIGYQVGSGEFVDAPPEFRDWVGQGGMERQAHVYERERPTGTYLEVRTTPIAGGGAVRTYTDITERKRREAELRDSEARLRISEERLAHALDSGSDGLWDWNLPTGEVWVSDRWYGMLGFQPMEVPAEVVALGTLIHPDDHGRVKAALVAHLKGETPLYECEYRLRNRAGEYGWFLARGRVVNRAESGRAIRIVGTHIDITNRKEAESQIAHLARHDALTNLPNRAFFRTCLDQRVAEVRRGGGEVAVLSLDLDRFKAVNDTLGHPAGDALLWEVAHRLKDALRTDDTVARLGGDEFAILLAGTEKDATRAARVAQRLIEAVAAPVWIEGHEIDIGVSIGVAIANGADLDGETLFKRADHALYQAKAAGRNVFRFYDTEMDAAAEEHRRIELGLRGALDRGEFEVHYQPVVASADARICGFEALVRWRHPERGLVPPGAFIPIAEETGLIVQIGAWVLRSACMAAASWPADVTVAVNVSAVQFRRDGLVESVIAALAASGLPASRLELEITESVLMQEGGAVLDVLDRLRAFGIRIALDDFGTGYSSLSYLRRFPLDKLKIDRSFVADIGDADTAAIVRAIIGMGSRLGMRITAEGVETREQFEFLRAEGCDEIQGYYVSRAVPIQDATALLAGGRAENAA